MEVPYFFRGLLIGLSIAAPVGPIGLLCVNRSLSGGWLRGFISGIGAACADAIYGCIGGFGLTAITSFLTSNKYWLQTFGGMFLLYLGVNAYKTAPVKQNNIGHTGSLVSSFLSVFALTLSNPMTILGFTAIFAAFGLGNGGDIFSTLQLVLGVFIGSALWWLFLSSLAAYFKDRLNDKKLELINKIAGIIIIFFGLLAILT
ncbi:LysE family translocator [Desulforamulus aquiferis]|uniref:LysE family transporter n=1 Tax=Desulforamulus aquiferis TaxID=1397668 RepID=A0AAW7ZCY5_9FIRM|nr:LysE family transporter [Desulforamulus aquiferis]MDO7787261.1 LysE family transporter [Desulforamulus aquiferis]